MAHVGNESSSAASGLFGMILGLVTAVAMIAAMVPIQSAFAMFATAAFPAAPMPM